MIRTKHQDWKQTEASLSSCMMFPWISFAYHATYGKKNEIQANDTFHEQKRRAIILRQKQALEISILTSSIIVKKEKTNFNWSMQVTNQ